MRSIKEILDAKSIAVVGASQNPFKTGSMLIQVLKEFQFRGDVAGVNPSGGEIHGVKLYQKLADIPFKVELVSLIIPPLAVPQALKECAEIGVKGVVISSEGFAESGENGRIIQDEVAKVLKETGIRAFGPNTLGLVNTETAMTTSYFSNEQMLEPGSIGFAAQSGIFIGALLRHIASIEGLRLSKGLGLGNKIDVDESDALDYFREDEQTKIIALYLEDIKNGRRFLTAAKKAVSEKPVLLLKGGRTAQGATATASHTASLAVNDTVFDGVLKQAGVLRMENIEEMIWTLMGFEWMPLPKGNRIALVTFSGAQAIMSLDMAINEKLVLAKFTDKTKKRLAAVFASAHKTKNPVDIFPDMMTHGFEKISTETVGALMDDENVDGIIFITFSDGGTETLKPLADLVNKSGTKPVFTTLIGKKEDTAISSQFLLENRIPCFAYPETAVRVFSNMWKYACVKNLH